MTDTNFPVPNYSVHRRIFVVVDDTECDSPEAAAHAYASEQASEITANLLSVAHRKHQEYYSTYGPEAWRCQGNDPLQNAAKAEVDAEYAKFDAEWDRLHALAYEFALPHFVNLFKE